MHEWGDNRLGSNDTEQFPTTTPEEKPHLVLIVRGDLFNRYPNAVVYAVDAIEDDLAVARGPGDAPDIDGVVAVEGAPDAKPGDFLKVRITDSNEYDLAAVAL